MTTAATIGVPMVGNLLSSFRIGGDIRGLSNNTSVAKMRAAAQFSPARMYVDVGARTYRVQIWRKTGTPGWVDEGPTQTLSSNVNFGFGSVGTPPPNTQGTIGMADTCRADDNVTAIAGTACIVFNSRGLPIDAAGAPIGSGAFYLRDVTTVYGVTISATGMVRVWRTPLAATPIWSIQ
jgi:hypothetical protein